MDVLEKLNRRFGAWYENLFGGRDDELRPRDILRRIVADMEDQRREGLDGQSYVPNVCTIAVAVQDDEERDYLRAFLDAEELADAVAQRMRQHGYQTRGPLAIAVEEVPWSEGAPRLQIRCRYEAGPLPADPEPDPEAAPAASAPVSEEPRTVAAPAAPFALLDIVHADGRHEQVPVPATGLRIGRSRQSGNDLVLADDPMVSKRHAHLGVAHGRLTLRDDGSTNGTRVRESVVPPGSPWALEDGDTVTLGRTRITVRVQGDPATVPAPGVAPAPAPDYDPIAAPVPAAAPVLPTAFRLIAGDGEVFALASRMMVGRALTDDIVLIGDGVSAQHARLTVHGGAVMVEDLDAPGGTRVNGERIPPNFPVALYPGDQVAFGQVQLRLTSGGHA